MDEPMTMVYRAQDPVMLKAVKAGDKVKFDAENVNGQYLGRITSPFNLRDELKKPRIEIRGFSCLSSRLAVGRPI